MTDEKGSYVADALSDHAIRSAGYFDSQKVTLLSKKFSRGSKRVANEVQNMALIGILTTQLLHQQYVVDFDPERIEPVVPHRLVRKLHEP